MIGAILYIALLAGIVVAAVHLRGEFDRIWRVRHYTRLASEGADGANRTPSVTSGARRVPPRESPRSSDAPRGQN